MNLVTYFNAAGQSVYTVKISVSNTGVILSAFDLVYVGGTPLDSSKQIVSLTSIFNYTNLLYATVGGTLTLTWLTGNFVSAVYT